MIVAAHCMAVWTIDKAISPEKIGDRQMTKAGDKVYVVSGHHNQCYCGIFTSVFTSEDKMLYYVQALMANDMRLTHGQFINMKNSNRKEFDNRFMDSGDRSYEECIEEGEYYCENGYEFSFGKAEIE